MIRAFIALTLSSGVIKYLDEVVSKLSKQDMKASWTKPGNFHLTLKFLGDVEESLIPEIISKLKNIKVKLPEKFELTNISFFPNPRNPRVIWYGINDYISHNLHKQVQGVCAELGFEKDSKPFKPHLTLSRIKSKTENCENLSNKIVENKVVGYFEKLALIKSELSSNGPTYTVLTGPVE